MFVKQFYGVLDVVVFKCIQQRTLFKLFVDKLCGSIQIVDFPVN